MKLTMYYVYILRHPTEDRIYIGFSADLRSRVKGHATSIQIGGWLIMKPMPMKRMPVTEKSD